MRKAVSYDFPIGASWNAKAKPFYANGSQSVVPEPPAPENVFKCKLSLALVH